MGRIDLDDLNWERRKYDRWRAYGQSKLANLLFTIELQRRLDEAGSAVRALAAHPGYASTGLQGHTGNPLQHALMWVANRVVAQSDAAGAEPTSTRRPRTCPATPTSVRTASRRCAASRRWSAARSGRSTRRPRAGLWKLSEELTGVGFVIQPTA